MVEIGSSNQLQLLKAVKLDCSERGLVQDAIYGGGKGHPTLFGLQIE
jgi:hypothetical protein